MLEKVPKILPVERDLKMFTFQRLGFHSNNGNLLSVEQAPLRQFLSGSPFIAYPGW